MAAADLLAGDAAGIFRARRARQRGDRVRRRGLDQISCARANNRGQTAVRGGLSSRQGIAGEEEKHRYIHENPGTKFFVGTGFLKNKL